MLTRSLSILVLSVAYLLSQTQSRLDGIVSDSTGAVIAGATVVARNVATGVAYSAKTNESGSYTIPFLPPAEYELTGEVAGFQKDVPGGGTLEPGSTQTLNLRTYLGRLCHTAPSTTPTPLLHPPHPSI